MDSKRIILLSNNNISQPLFEWLISKGHQVHFVEDIPTSLQYTDKPDLMISYCYKYIIPESVIEWMEGNIVNLHISYLPWNRGTSPNFWSFVENTPKGVTLHYINKKLDTGAIIAQTLVSVSCQETFSETYQKLHQAALHMFTDAFEQYEYWKIIAKDQIGEGSYHTRKQLTELVGADFDWNIKICDYLKYKR